MELFNEIYLHKWEDFVDLFKNYNLEEKKFIFRGHSNTVTKNKFQKWSIVSTFNRSQKYLDTYSFKEYLYQHFGASLFQTYYDKYAYDKISSLINVSLLEKCYFFQHYGIPTCFIDFTFDPLIALYFSISSITGRSGGKFDDEGNPLFYSNETNRDFVSIYQIDTKLLKGTLKIKEINGESFCLEGLENYKVPHSKFSHTNAYMGLDLDPQSKIKDLAGNYNLNSQKGCFLYYDNEGFQGKSFEHFINSFSIENSIKIKSHIITIYNINYNSLFKKMRSRQPNHIPLFKFLKEKKLTGQYLFNDIQGLKYDFNFFHQQ